MDERGAAVGTSAEMWRSLLESAATSHLAGAKTKSKENQSLSHHLRDKCQPLPKLSSIERVTIYPSTLTPDLWSRPASCHHLAGDTMEEVDALLKNLQESISGQPSASWPAALHTPTTPTTAAATHSSFATYDSALSHEPWVRNSDLYLIFRFVFLFLMVGCKEEQWERDDIVRGNPSDARC